MGRQELWDWELEELGSPVQTQRSVRGGKDLEDEQDQSQGDKFGSRRIEQTRGGLKERKGELPPKLTDEDGMVASEQR